MQVKRFLAADMRRALEMVRQELGPDAVILSSNRTKDGVELLTSRPAADLSQGPEDVSAESVPEGPQTGRERADAIERSRQKQLAQRELEASAEEYLQPNQRVNAGIRVKRSLLAVKSEPTQAPRPTSAAERYPLRDAAAPKSARPASEVTEGQSDPRLESLQAELAEMRLLLEDQLSQLVAPDSRKHLPIRTASQASIGRRLERMGLPNELADTVVKEAPAGQTLAQRWSGALAQVSRQIPVKGDDVVSKGGVFAFVGPTGAGKTTTIGKLAARYVIENGPEDVALVTLDTHRIGGHDQLRSLARILGVTIKVVDDQSRLESVLYSLRRCSLVLIDTAGFRQGDPRLAEQMEALSLQPGIQPLLVLPSTSQPAMLKASVHAYGGAQLMGCILTKLDESTSLGEALGVVMQAGVPIVYTTDGQDIPRDIEVARPHQLVTRAASLISRQERAAVNHEQSPEASVASRVV